jgi:hypothetical protein
VSVGLEIMGVVLVSSVEGLFVLFGFIGVSQLLARELQGCLLMARGVQWACFRAAVFKQVLKALDQGLSQAGCMLDQIG